MVLSQELLDAILGLSILLGAIICFFGYRIFKFIIRLIGFLLGSAMAGAFGYAVFQNEAAALLTGILGGFIGAALMGALYFAGIFLLGAILGGGLGTVFYAAAETKPEPAVLLILAVIFGITALIYQKFMIIASTGFGGAWSIVIGTAYFTSEIIDPVYFKMRARGSQLYAILVCWIVLGIVSIIVQYRSGNKKKALKKSKYSELPHTDES